jgi:excisionase family DNA binding protein
MGARGDAVKTKKKKMKPALTIAATPALQLLLKPDEAASALGICARKLWELTNSGLIPCVRIGRSVRYDPRDLSSWIDSAKLKQQV